MLEYLGRTSKRPGDKVSLTPSIYPLFDAQESGELTYLLETLAERGDILRVDGARWILKAAGWERLDPLSPGGVSGTCFVAMAFAPELDPAFDDGIRPAVENDCQMAVVRVDRVEHNGVVTDLIIASIRSAQVVVADVTLQRSGVYFEAGFALGLPRTVIWSVRHDDLVNVHFDTRQYSHVVWETPTELRAKLAARIRATVLVPSW
jgi:nucleoside 2-deoxyribosyltransferase